MSNNKEKLDNYIIRFAINLLNKSETIRMYIDIPKNNYQPTISWNYIIEQFKHLPNDDKVKKHIRRDILKLICHDNFKIITTDIKGIDLRYLVTEKIINECYLTITP